MSFPSGGLAGVDFLAVLFLAADFDLSSFREGFVRAFPDDAVLAGDVRFDVPGFDRGSRLLLELLAERFDFDVVATEFLPEVFFCVRPEFFVPADFCATAVPGLLCAPLFPDVGCAALLVDD